MSNFFQTRLENLRGVGVQRGQLLGKELGCLPTATSFSATLSLPRPHPVLQRGRPARRPALCAGEGVLRGKEVIGEGPKKRLVAKVGDASGELEVVWFKA